MQTIDLDIATPKWAEPLIAPSRYKAASGGRSSGKSHFLAELAVEEMVCDPELRFVCIREVQRSLKFSAKSLVEAKIRKFGLAEHFDVLEREIRRVGGSGVMIFEGMQDHTADSLKSLEDFGRAWVEEAQNISARSLNLLIPTIRSRGSEIWFSWNPDQPDDPVDEFFGGGNPELLPEGAVHVHCTYLDNPFREPEVDAAARLLQKRDPDLYEHIWLGKYNVRSEAQVLAGKWRVDAFEPKASWDGPYFGIDWGFSQDPTVLVRCWLADGRLYVDYDVGGVGIDFDELPALIRGVPLAKDHVIRADSSAPATISHVRNKGFRVEGAPKWPGSVEDGIRYLRSCEEIVIHERCRGAIDEARHWRYKTDRLTGDPLPKLQDGYEHRWDAVRYALAPMIRQTEQLPPLISQSHYTG